MNTQNSPGGKSTMTDNNNGPSQCRTKDCSNISGNSEQSKPSFEGLSKSHNITDGCTSLSHAKSEELLHETKYVMLNFMSLIPPKLYKDHVHPSPDLTKPNSTGGYRFTKSHLSKSKSFDVVHLGKTHRQSQLSRARALDRDLDSPQSEDNVNYRYRQNQVGFGQLHGTPSSVSSQIDQHLDELDGLKDIQGVSSIEGLSSAEGSPRKSSQTVNRMYSDTSSCGEYSYYSDADDEFEVSASSSTFSIASVSQTDGLLDLRKSSSVLKQHIARSVSELEELDHLKLTHTDTIPETQDEENEEEVTKESTDTKPINIRDHGEGDGLDQADAPIFAISGRGIADRSKLKLTIPPQPVVLDDILLSLQSELNSEISEIESEFEDVLQSTGDVTKTQPPVTPTQAARTLARIGDEVMEQYSGQIASTVSHLFLYKIGELSYQQFKEISTVMIDRKLPGWRQVALLMVYGQTAAWYAVKDGNKNIGNIVDYCSRFVFDVAAEFIIKEGGWGAVMNFDPSQSSESQSSADFESPSTDYFISHNLTQVESNPTQNTDQPTCSTNGDTQHSSNISDLSYSLGTHIAQDAVNNFTQQLLQPEGIQTYKPSLGFDFRNVLTPTGGAEGSLKSNPNSSNSLQFVFDNGVEQLEENGAVFDDESNEDVFDNGEYNDGNDENVNKGVNKTQDDNVDGSLSTLSTKYRVNNQISIKSTVTDSAKDVDSYEVVKRSSEDYNDGDDILAESIDNHKLDTEVDNQISAQYGTEVHRAETNNSPEPVNLKLKRSDDLKDNDTESSENKDVVSESMFGYLHVTRTKVLLVAGAAAAVGLGLKLFGR